jgi:hypothetical protein
MALLTDRLRQRNAVHGGDKRLMILKNRYQKVEVLPNKETVQQTKEKRKKGE